MRHVALVLLLLSHHALAQAATESLDAGVPAVPTGRVALYATTAATVVIATAVVSTLAGSLLPMAVFDAQNRPDPLALAGGFVIGALVNAAVLHLTLPLLTSVATTDGVTASTTQARGHAWTASRWALLGMAVGALTLTLGAIPERERFASGQWAMLVGAGTLLVSGVTFDVLEAVFAWRGFVASRQRASP